MTNTARLQHNQPCYGCIAEKRAKPHIMHMDIRSASITVSSFSYNFYSILLVY